MLDCLPAEVTQKPGCSIRRHLNCIRLKLTGGRSGCQPASAQAVECLPRLVLDRDDHRREPAFDQPEALAHAAIGEIRRAGPRREGVHHLAHRVGAIEILPPDAIEPGVALPPVDLLKISTHRLRRERIIPVIGLHPLHVADEALDLARWLRLSRAEDRDDAVLDRASPLAIASASSLGNLIEARLGTPYTWKIKIDAGFNKAGGDQPAGNTILQPVSNRRKNLTTISGSLSCRQMDRTVEAGRLHGTIESQRMRAAVHDHQRLSVVTQRRYEVIVGHLAGELQLEAPE